MLVILLESLFFFVLYYMLGQVNQERDWDLPQALCATVRKYYQRAFTGLITGPMCYPLEAAGEILYQTLTPAELAFPCHWQVPIDARRKMTTLAEGLPYQIVTTAKGGAWGLNLH